ncbi:hypothetical protein [Pseudomonas protegens]|uniref:hypothetical protein n=1 Tax=Pseudomonas protegens TaxID=380021 RepID=UPI00385722AE
MEKVIPGRSFRQICAYRAIPPIDSSFEWINEGGPKKQPCLIHLLRRPTIFCGSIGPLLDQDDGRREYDGLIITAGRWSWRQTRQRQKSAPGRRNHSSEPIEPLTKASGGGMVNNG